MTLSFIYVTPQMFPTIAGIAIIAAVCYMLGLYSGAYMFPMIAPEPCPGLTPEEKKLIAELHEMIYAEYSANLFEKQCSDDIEAYLDSLDEESTIPYNGHSAHCPGVGIPSVAAVDVQKSGIYVTLETPTNPENTRWGPFTRCGYEYHITDFIEGAFWCYQGYILTEDEEEEPIICSWSASGRFTTEEEHPYDLIPVKEDNNA
jgi:hypothetical protein